MRCFLYDTIPRGEHRLKDKRLRRKLKCNQSLRRFFQHLPRAPNCSCNYKCVEYVEYLSSPVSGNDVFGNVSAGVRRNYPAVDISR